eukprot:gnl/MRDRNA2_/MRDRNA2_78379_c0_seq1.p1 gnl/MRDRNA2_/MRDRNA2_78379_c0~~gnl/MRDRNA2_/MRDRNA2_78379_c0_seq1.p1  ORF type:complete len:818 (-),score=156.33 gnl/MRDRNA2_/MRDRNA2_78379_c0_seq1:86-2539(-)
MAEEWPNAWNANGRLSWEIEMAERWQSQHANGIMGAKWPWEPQQAVGCKSPEDCRSPERTSRPNGEFHKRLEQEKLDSELQGLELRSRQVSPTEYEATVSLLAGVSIPRASSAEAQASFKADIDRLCSRFNVAIKPGLHDEAGVKSIVVTGLQNNVALVQPELISILQCHTQSAPANGHVTLEAPHGKQKEPDVQDWELQYRQVSLTNSMCEATLRIPAGHSIPHKLSAETLADLKKGIDWVGGRCNVLVKPGLHDGAGMQSVVITGLRSNIELARSELVQILQFYATSSPPSEERTDAKCGNAAYGFGQSNGTSHRNPPRAKAVEEPESCDWEMSCRQIHPTLHEATIRIPAAHAIPRHLAVEVMEDLRKSIDWVGSRFNVVVKPGSQDTSGMRNVTITGLQTNIELAKEELIQILKFFGRNAGHAEADGRACSSTLQLKGTEAKGHEVRQVEKLGTQDWELLSSKISPTLHEATLRIPSGCSISLKMPVEQIRGFREGIDWAASRFNVDVKPGPSSDGCIRSVVIKGLPSNIELARPELIRILNDYSVPMDVAKAASQDHTRHFASTGSCRALSEVWRGHLKERQEIIQTALAMNAQGINQGTSGNVSVRVPGGFLITASGIPYDAMKPDQVVYVDDEGGYYGDYLPSSEWRMHKDIYTNTPAAMAVVHTHSTFATALSCQRRDIPAFHYMVGAAGGKVIPCAEYGTFGTQELSDSILKAMREAGTRACLMANHGVICHSANLKKALGLAVEIECLAKQYNYACTYGPPIILDDAEMDIILAKFKTYGKQLSEIKCMGCFDQTHAVIPPPRRDQP